MASLSLPRVLQLKKNSLDAEREHFEKFQTLAIQKAINAVETPVKEKHVRSTIIGTFQEQSAITYWMVAVRLPLQDNRIVSWKFCHVTHKLLREGHPACLDDSQRHIGMIENLGKLWVHLREGYGKLVHLYCNLLVCKLKFHARNPRFPGNMQLTADELDAIAENDVNNYFQLCVELFDYMDDILSLQAAVFDSLGNARANSMTASGQCRLAALIPCAQDSSQIYDCNVRLLFRLHAALPADTLQGHRERFRQQFKKLSSFYKHASSLQYYRNLLTLPVLPANPPNFLLQSDFGTYVTPVVSIPEQPPDEVDSVGALIDTSDTMSQLLDTIDTSDTMSEISQEHLEESFERPTPSPQPDPIVERDRLIEHLQNELKRMRSEVSQLVQERNTMLGSMREHCTRLESQLQTAKSELGEEKQKSEMLAVQTPEIKQKLSETEEKAKVQDEKFQKLKSAYTQLREEHISLIRQKAEVDKLSATLRAAAAQHESAKVQLQQQLNDRTKDVELLQQSASSNEEIEGYQNQISTLRSELEQSRQKELELETVKASLEALEIEHKTAKAEQDEKINTISNELKEAMESLEVIKREKEERETELSRVKMELVGLREKSGDEYKKVVEEKEAALKQVVELTEQHQQEKEELTQQMRDCIEKLQAEINSLQQNLLDTEKNYTMECERINEELAERHKEFDNILVEKDFEIKEALDKLEALQIELGNTKLNYENKLEDLVSHKDHEINTLKDEIKSILDKNDNEINTLQKLLDETSHSGELQKSETQELSNRIMELEASIVLKDKEIENSKFNLNQLSSALEKNKIEYENAIKESKHHLEILEVKLQNVTENKEDITNNFKSMVAEKDSQVIALNVQVTKLSEEVSRLNDQLTETQAELEIGNNELMTLKEEHENIIHRNDANLTLKNKELRDLHEELKSLKKKNTQLEAEKDVLINETSQEKQVLITENMQIREFQTKLTAELDILQSEKEVLESKLSDEINNMKEEFDKAINHKDNEIKRINDQIQSQEISFKREIIDKDEMIRQTEENNEVLKTEIEELQTLRAKEKDSTELIVSEKDNEKQMLEARLSHTDMERLNAESELQDLLQHNSVLEADLAAVKKQLEEAQWKIEEQSSKLVTCSGETALEIMSNALASLERSNAQESNKAAAELASKALEDLARQTQIKGNEESIAKSAVSVAHNAAQLSAYVTEVSHISTNMELSDKLTDECRSMLTATKQCLETLSKGELAPTCLETKGLVRRMVKAATAADTAGVGARSVDDELAEMDQAIEQAASKIEEMLAASRAADSGVKLEVNENILDACTTLMGAVKILVQDARKLQNELGDPKTRQNMYRKNPQWSEGLISAAKAVVFAAKLLVSSADEVVGSGGGRVEGVSAAAHEVAGATAQLVAASRARAPPAAPALARLTLASRHVAAAVGALVAAVRAAAATHRDREALDTSALTLTATRRLEMESKVRSLELETALEAERIRLAALRKRHYQLAQAEENGNVTNGK